MVGCRRGRHTRISCPLRRGRNSMQVPGIDAVFPLKNTPRNSVTVIPVTAIRLFEQKLLFDCVDCRWFPRRDLHAAVGGTASRLSRLAIRDLGLISHRAETRPLSPPLSLPGYPSTTDNRAPRTRLLVLAYALADRGKGSL